VKQQIAARMRQLSFLLGFCLGANGCAFGPRVLERSHVLYNESLKQVHEEQLLLNLVRLRYNDDVTRLDVSSIAAQYELSGMAQAVPFFTAAGSGAGTGGAFLNQSFQAILPGAQALGANRPTLALTPGDDHETVQRYLRPLDAETLIFFAQVGWPIATIYRIYADSINDIPNARAAAGPVRNVVPEFEEFQHVVALLQSMQDADDIRVVPDEKWVPKSGELPFDGMQLNPFEAAKEGYEYKRGPDLRKKDKKDDEDPKETVRTFVLYKRERRLIAHVKPEALGKPEGQELMRALHLQPSPEYEIKVAPSKPPGPVPQPDDATQIRLVPRSTIQALLYLARGVEVPASHQCSGLAPTTVGPDGRLFDWTQVTRGLFTVHACKQLCRPKHAHVAVRYHDHWFYIDAADQESKATFALILQLVRLDVSSRRSSGPVLTLPVAP
jgi:hypothetical protein